MAHSRARVAMSSFTRRNVRHVANLFGRSRFANKKISENLSHLIKQHESPIYRNFSGVDRKLFTGKLVNLKIAASKCDHLIIPPGKIFSMWHSVGNPCAKNGYQEGLAILHGRPCTSTGGGLCQLANSIYWLFLHTDVRILERHRHSLDIFPDDNRQVPFGTGATVVYNFKDLRLLNNTDTAYQLTFSFTDTHMITTLYASNAPKHFYRVFERDAKYRKAGDAYYRSNIISREKYLPDNCVVDIDDLYSNDCRCLYNPGGIV